MRKSVKKVLSGIMAGMMILTAAPVSALAANYTPGQVIEKADLPAAKSLSPKLDVVWTCLLYTSPSPRDLSTSRMPSSA